MRVLLADDDPHVRSALRLLLENEPGVLIVGECVAADGLVETVTCVRATVVFLDWDLPGLRTDGMLQRLRLAHPTCRIVVLSGRPEQRADALRAGATRFVSKGDAPETLLTALHDLEPGEADGQSDHQPEDHVRRPEALEVVQQGVHQPSAKTG